MLACTFAALRQPNGLLLDKQTGERGPNAEVNDMTSYSEAVVSLTQPVKEVAGEHQKGEDAVAMAKPKRSRFLLLS